MKRTLLPFFILALALLTSCSTTHLFSDIDSANISTWVDQQGYFHSQVEDDDSVTVVHSFDWKSQQLAMSIMNESSRTLYIDWNKSSISINSITKRYDYITNVADNTTSIQPYSQASVKIDNFQKIKLDDLTSNTSYSTSYSEEESPYKIKNHLTLYRTSDELFGMDETFYVSKVIKTSQKKPKYIDFERGNLLYAKSSKVNYKQIGTIAATVVLVPLAVVGYAALDIDTEE